MPTLILENCFVPFDFVGDGCTRCEFDCGLVGVLIVF